MEMAEGGYHTPTQMLRWLSRKGRLIAAILLGVAVLAPCVSAQVNNSIVSADPRELSIDIFTNLKRDTDPDAIAARISLLVPAFRYPCPRVTDYQIYRAMNNLYDLKVKCSGMPFYGVTVAANGYVAVYGGNGIIEPFDQRDGLVFSFDADGAVIDTSAVEASDLVDNAVTQLQQGDFYFNTTYLGLLLIGLFTILGGAGFVWVKALRRRARLYRTKPRSKLKAPLEKVEMPAGIALSSELKNQLQGEAEITSRHVYKHPAGFYIARGSKGRRRLFKGQFGARLYAKFNIKLRELDASALDRRLRAWVDAPAESGT